MSYPIFNFVPSFGTRKQHAPKLYKAAFGDGYVQKVRAGINNNPVSYDLQFPARDWTVLALVDQFLKDRGGSDPFYWMSPSDGVRLFTCESWDRQQVDSHIEAITATFTEFFTAEPLPGSIAIMIDAVVLV